MARFSRRQFLGTTLASAGTLALSRRKVLGNVLGANEKLKIAVAGFNGRGDSHIGAWSGMKDVELAYLIDPDQRIWEKQIKEVEKKTGKAPKAFQDVRKALDDKSLDAISIATPNHWHALMTIWACQAGKHVYVEKPMCHNALEGAAAVEASQKYKKVVHHGTQNRSEPTWAAAMAAAYSGKMGKVQLVRGFCYKDGGEGPKSRSTRGDIGFAPEKAPPSELDFNLWVGPAPRQAYHENLVHYRWHYFWDFGNGDLGNQGVHQMDVMHWSLPPGTKFPKSVVSAGGRFKYKDQGQVPNSIISFFDFDGLPAIFEVRGLKSERYHGTDIGNIIVLDTGEIRGGSKNPQFYPLENGKLAEKSTPMPEVEYHIEQGSHFRNFIDAVHANDINKSNAPAQKAYYSSALCHLGNASYKAGQPTKFDVKKGTFADNPAASDAFGRMEEYLVKSGLKLEDTEYVAGANLTLPDQSTWKTSNEAANAFLSGAKQYREGFSLPKDLVASLS